jgi:hypothetical protein
MHQLVINHGYIPSTYQNKLLFFLMTSRIMIKSKGSKLCIFIYEKRNLRQVDYNKIERDKLYIFIYEKNL